MQGAQQDEIGKVADELQTEQRTRGDMIRNIGGRCAIRTNHSIVSTWQQ